MIATAVSSVRRKEIRRKGVCSTDTADTLSKKEWTAESESIKHLRTRNRKLRKSVRYIVGAQRIQKSLAQLQCLSMINLQKKTRDEAPLNALSRRHSRVKDGLSEVTQLPIPIAAPPPPPSPPPSPPMVPKVPKGTNYPHPTVAITTKIMEIKTSQLWNLNYSVSAFCRPYFFRQTKIIFPANHLLFLTSRKIRCLK